MKQNIYVLSERIISYYQFDFKYYYEKSRYLNVVISNVALR